jgi:hypothetical protein
VRHHASTAPQAHNRTCFRDCKLAEGKGTLITVTKAPHAPEAGSTVVNIIIEHTGAGECLGYVQAEPSIMGCPGDATLSLFPPLMLWLWLRLREI